MQTYESTFSSSADPDKRFLGLLNQMYAIACQVGGTGILPGEEFQYGVSFYQRSLAIMYPLVLQAESILALQCVLLMVSTGTTAHGSILTIMYYRARIFSR